MRTAQTQVRFTMMDREAVTEQAPLPVPADWEIWVATRPMMGTWRHSSEPVFAWEGEWVGGRLYAAIDPNEEFADYKRQENISLDGYRLVFVSVEQALDAYYQYLERTNPKILANWDKALERQGREKVAANYLRNANQNPTGPRAELLFEVLEADRQAA